jgi:hypothetical protein
MNFAWMLREINTAFAFWTLGVGLVLGSGVGVALWVARRIERGALDD